MIDSLISTVIVYTIFCISPSVITSASLGISSMTVIIVATVWLWLSIALRGTKLPSTKVALYILFLVAISIVTGVTKHNVSLVNIGLGIGFVSGVALARQRYRKWLQLFLIVILACGCLQFALHYLMGYDLAFFSYQSEQISRLNYFNGYYRANSLFFEPGDFSSAVVQLSALLLSTSSNSWAERSSLVWLNLVGLFITLSAGGALSFVVLLIAFYRKDLAVLAGKWGNLLAGLRFRLIDLIKLTSVAMILYTVVSYMIRKKIGSIDDVSFNARAPVLEYMYSLTSFVRIKDIIWGGGISLYDNFRLLESLSYGASLFLVYGLAGIMFISASGVWLGFEFPLVIMASRAPLAGLYICLLILVALKEKRVAGDYFRWMAR